MTSPPFIGFISKTNDSDIEQDAMQHPAHFSTFSSTYYSYESIRSQTHLVTKERGTMLKPGSIRNIVVAYKGTCAIGKGIGTVILAHNDDRVVITTPDFLNRDEDYLPLMLYHFSSNDPEEVLSKYNEMIGVCVSMSPDDRMFTDRDRDHYTPARTYGPEAVQLLKYAIEKGGGQA